MVAALLTLALMGSGTRLFGRVQAWELRVCADPVSLPFSSSREEGFENRIAALLAEELHAEVGYDWHLFNDDMINLRLREGECDLIMGVPDGYRNLLTTVAYYQSPYVFIYRAGSPFQIDSLDDPRLQELRIGVQSVGIPPYESLLRRGLAPNVVARFGLRVGTPDRLSEIVDAVALGDVDLGVAWGPVAGYFARRQEAELEIVPINPRFDLPAIFMSTPMTIGVRPGDEALRDRLNIAIANRWEEIQQVLAAYGVPVDPLPRPVLTRGRPAPEEPSRPFRVGVVIPTMTGAVAVQASLYDIVGEAARMGAVLAAEDLAAQAARTGLETQVLMASAPSAAAALRAGRRLLEVEGVHALVGGLGAGQAEVLAGLAREYRVPFLNIGSPSGALRRTCDPFVFHVEASSSMYLDAMVDWFSSQGGRRWFIVYAEGGEGGALRDRAWQAIARRRPEAEVLAALPVQPEQPSYLPELAAIRDSGADVVLLLVDARDQVAFLSQLTGLGIDLTVAPFPDPVTQTRDFLAAARFRYDSVAPGGRVALWEPTLAREGAAGLNQRFTSRWGRPMDPPAWAAYQSIRMLSQAAAAAGALDGAALVQYLEDPGTTFETGKGPGVSFRPWDHQLRQPLYVVQADPDARWGVAAPEQLALARMIAEIPDPDEVEGDAALRLDRLGDGPGAPGC